jgi:hypothetical protein
MELLNDSWIALNVLFSFVWVICAISWIRNGVSVPPYIHGIAIALGLVTIGAVGIGGFVGLFTLKSAMVTLLLVPAFPYVGWFWMFGPELVEGK